MDIEQTAQDELRMTREDWRMTEELDAIEYLEHSKRVRAFGGWLDEQVEAIKGSE